MNHLSNRDQVLKAIAEVGHPQTANQLFTACDCFADAKDAAALLHQMTMARELTSFRAAGESFMRFGTPGMSFDVPKVTAAPVIHVPVAKVQSRMPDPPRAQVVPEAPATPKKPGRDGDANRRRIMDALDGATRAISTTKICEVVKLSQKTVHRHLVLLIAASLVQAYGCQSQRRYALEGSKAAEAEDAIQEAAAMAVKPARPMSVAYDTGRRIVQALTEAGMPLARPVLAEALGVHKQKISDYIGDLLKSGAVVRFGSGPRVTFGLPGMEAPPAVEHKNKPRPEAETAAGRVLASIEAAGVPISSLPIRSATGFAPSYVNRILNDLLRQGRIKRTGRGSGTNYAIADAQGSAPAKPEPIAAAAKLTASKEHWQSQPSLAQTASAIQAENRGDLPRTDVAVSPPSLPAERGDPVMLNQAIALLRATLPPAEFRGFLKGNMIALSMRGVPEDMRTFKVFDTALAEVA